MPLRKDHLASLFQAHTHLLSIAVSSDFFDEEVKEKCKEMSDYLREKLYDPLLGAPPEIRAKHRNRAV